MYCFAARTPATRSAGPVTQPTFQPVQLSILPALEMRSVRSAIPGSVEMDTCSMPSKVRCSYTSSEIAIASNSWHRAAICSRSSRGRTAPVGLCGVFTSTARVRGENAARSESTSSRKRPSFRTIRAGRRVAPAIAMVAA